MKEHPILFTGEMVRAILDGYKTQTRRVVLPTMTRPRVAPLRMEPWIIDGEQETDEHGYPCWTGFHPDYPGEAKWFTCPYGGVGDRLWVRETWGMHFGELRYRATEDPQGYYYGAKGWKPSIHMPRALSRITLEIVGVRCERVQDISEADAWAEGAHIIARRLPYSGDDLGYMAFSGLWEQINAKRGYSWDGNPWVWVVEFKRVQP